jgi:hypothetical protein
VTNPQQSQDRYKVARDGVEIGEFTKKELLQLYYEQKITLGDYLWREGLSEWKTLYDLYVEFLETPEQLRAYDREIQMTTKTSYRLKYLIQKSYERIQVKKKAPADYKKMQAEMKKEAIKIRQRLERTKDLDGQESLRSELIQVEGEMEMNSASHEGRDKEYTKMEIDETKEQIETLQSMRIAFWWISFDKDPPKLNKKDLKRLTQSYESRVSQILRGGVPWSSNYFELGSLFSMPSNRSLYENYAKNYPRPSEAEISLILKSLDEQDPEWDATSPEQFYSNLKPTTPI